MAHETTSFSDAPKMESQHYLPLLEYKGFWFLSNLINSFPLLETQYKPLPTDVLVASFPKSGTTWLKALTFKILHFHAPNDLLQTHSPHELVPFLESFLIGDPDVKIDETSSPRIFGTHIPYSILTEKVKEISSGCKIIYISRNPADIIVSGWKFHNKGFGGQKTLQEYFDEFIKGFTLVGPLFNHVLEYWGQRGRENMFFITYEELKKKPNENVKRLAEFLGCSLSNDEIEEVLRKTSFECLSKLDLNTDEDKGVFVNEKLKIPFNLFYRKGNVGDGKNYLSPEMMERLNVIAYQKWAGSGLEFKLLDFEP